MSAPIHRTHIMTVGTSLLSNVGWTPEKPLQAKKALLKRLLEDPRSASAELNALIPFIEHGHCQSVHLVATRTPQGQRASDCIAQYLKSINVPITGAAERDLFAPLNGRAFLTAAIKMRDRLHTLIHRALNRGERVYVNATGGLKAEAMILAALATELQLPCYYIHADMKEPVFLPTTTPDQSLIKLLQTLHNGAPLAQADLQTLLEHGLVSGQRNADGQIRRPALTLWAKRWLPTKA